MEISIFDIIANGIGNADISKVIEEKLCEKYKEKFLVKRIGNRYGAENNETVTTFCTPTNNENLIFKVTLNQEQTKLEDDYKYRKVTYELEECIQKEFKKYNIEIIVKSEIIGKNKIEDFVSVQEFINKFENTSFLMYIITKEEISKEILEKIYNSLNTKYINIYLKSVIYNTNEKDYKELKEILKTVPSINSSIIEKYNGIQNAIIKIHENKVY